MAIPAPVDYTDRDFDALRARLFSLIQSVFPTWTDTAVANFGNVLVELFAYTGDVLSYYQDQQAREARIGTATLRKSMIALAKLIGYELANASPATADVTLTITNPGALTGTVAPAGGAPAVLSTNDYIDPVRGELDAPVAFAAGEVTKAFTWRHAVTQPLYQVASNGRADQGYLLAGTPFLWGAETVSTTGESGAWTRVDNFLASTASSQHYRVEVDQNDAATVTFGDNRNGKIPTGLIRVTYRTGGGLGGNVAAGTLSRVLTSFVDSAGTAATITATNALPATGGTARETTNAARVNAPASLRVLTRSVSREDFEINARRVPGVGRVLMATSNEDAAVAENTGHLYVVPTTGGVPSAGLLAAVTTMCTETYPSTVTFTLRVLPPTYKTINITGRVYLRANQTPSSVRAAIAAALEDWFAPVLADGTANPAVDFGWNYKDAEGLPAGEVAWSDLFNIIRDVAGVRKVDADLMLNGAGDDVALNPAEFPTLGTVTLLNGDTGGAL